MSLWVCDVHTLTLVMCYRYSKELLFVSEIQGHGFWVDRVVNCPPRFWSNFVEKQYLTTNHLLPFIMFLILPTILESKLPTTLRPIFAFFALLKILFLDIAVLNFPSPPLFLYFRNVISKWENDITRDRELISQRFCF